MSIHDLSDLWINQEFERQGKLIAEAEKAHRALKDKTTSYARGIARIIEVRKGIQKILRAPRGGEIHG